MGQFILRKGEQAIQGIPIGRLNNLDLRVKALEAGGGGGSPLTTKGELLYAIRRNKR